MKRLLINSVMAATAVFCFVQANVASAAMAQAGSYEVDQAHTSIGFAVTHMGFSMVIGRFNSFRGAFIFVPTGESSVNIEIDSASIDTNSERRDNHLRGADFFDVTQFPKLTFKSSSVSHDQNGDPQRIEGVLTMHGVSQTVVLDVRPIGAGEDLFGDVRSGYQATTQIKRSEFGMTNLLAAAGDEIEITINLEGIKQ